MDTTMNAVNDQAWHNLAATYIFDEEVRSKLDPYCLQSIIGWEMEKENLIISDMCQYITGQVINVDGGMVMYYKNYRLNIFYSK